MYVISQKMFYGIQSIHSLLLYIFRYNVLVRHLPDNASNIKCQQMLLKFDPQAKDWQMGHTKVREYCIIIMSKLWQRKW